MRSWATKWFTMRSCAHGHVGRLCLLTWPPPHPRASLTPSPSSGAAGVATELPRRWQLASLFGAKNCYTTPPTSEGVRVACARTAPFRASTPAARAAQTLLRGLLGSRPATASSRATSTPTAARRLEAAQQQSYKIQYPRKLVQELGHPAAPVCARFRHTCKYVPSLTTFPYSLGLGGGLLDHRQLPDGAAAPIPWARDLPQDVPGAGEAGQRRDQVLRAWAPGGTRHIPQAIWRHQEGCPSRRDLRLIWTHQASTNALDGCDGKVWSLA